MAVSFQLTFDAADPPALAKFWSEVLGYVAEPPPKGFASWDDWLVAMKIPEDRWTSVATLVDPDSCDRASSFSAFLSPRRPRTACTSTSTAAAIEVLLRTSVDPVSMQKSTDSYCVAPSRSMRVENLASTTS